MIIHILFCVVMFRIQTMCPSSLFLQNGVYNISVFVYLRQSVLWSDVIPFTMVPVQRAFKGRGSF